MKIEGLTNTFDRLNIDVNDIENQIRNYRLTFISDRNTFAEWEVKLPMFVPSFYNFLLDKQTVPKQYDYWRAYLENNANYFKEASFSKNITEGVRARIYRTYPSLVRDLHFGMMLKEVGCFEKVFFNETLDIEYGIDLVVFLNGKPLGLNLYTKTRNALLARNIKTYRPKKKVNFGCMELPISFRGSKTCGMFFLYSGREVENIIEVIISNA